MDMKYIALFGLAGFAAYYLWTSSDTGSVPSPPYPGAGTPVPPGGTYPGTNLTNDTGAWNWLTATGNLVNSLGSAFANIYPAVTSQNNAAAARGATIPLTQYLRALQARTIEVQASTVENITPLTF